MSCIIGDLKYIAKVSDNIAKEKLKLKLIPVLPQHIIIFHLIGTNPILFNDLQKKLQYSKSTLSDAINKYLELGLFDKFTCPNDKRNLYINLTPQGLKVLTQLVDMDNEIKSLLFNNFNADKIASTEMGIRSIVKNLENVPSEQ